ncbi:hypothetical protein BREVNS_2089 [Brevinematales bacterium NS]|nr:hypothetical protein BREVNS_2089 [Brevinematales bacterium NS]
MRRGQYPSGAAAGAEMGFSKGAKPLLPRAGALREKRNIGNKKSPKLKEKRWLNKYSVFV